MTRAKPAWTDPYHDIHHGWQLAVLLFRPRRDAFQGVQDMVPLRTAYALMLAAELVALVRTDDIEPALVLGAALSPLVGLVALGVVALVARAVCLPARDRYVHPLAALACQMGVLTGAARLARELAAFGPPALATVLSAALLLLLLMASTFQCAEQMEVRTGRAFGGLLLGWVALAVTVVLLGIVGAGLTGQIVGPTPP